MENLNAIKNVNLKLLQAFLHVASTRSFKAAACQTFRSQSALSAQIRQLENQLGVPLFHRTTRSVSLTAEGMQLHEYAGRALGEIEAGLRKIREAADVRSGKVALACSPTIAQSRLARVLAAFEAEYPGIDVSVREQSSSNIYESVRKREVDFGVGPAVAGEDFKFDYLFEDPFIALVPRKLYSTAAVTLPLARLATMPLLMLSSATALRGTLDTAMRERGLVFSARYEFAQAATLISMADAGLGAAILPSVAVPQNLGRNVHALPIVNPSLNRQIALITARGYALSPASVRLAEIIKQLLPEAVTRRKNSVRN